LGVAADAALPIVIDQQGAGGNAPDRNEARVAEQLPAAIVGDNGSPSALVVRACCDCPKPMSLREKCGSP